MIQKKPKPTETIAILVVLCILAMVILPLASVFLWAAGNGGITIQSADWAAIRFTLLQAALSAIFSVGFAIPLARAIARRDFRGRSMLITFMGVPFILPVLVAALGMLAIFGRNGVFNAALNTIGAPAFSVYGLHGVVITHVFLNLPLATRMFLNGWLSFPAERYRLAASLGFTPRDLSRHIERPMLRMIAPSALAIVFALCLTSFAVVLILGGGPGATTIELAIWQAVRFDFDLSRAAILAIVQLCLCVLAASLSLKAMRYAAFGKGMVTHSKGAVVPICAGGWRLYTDIFSLFISGLFLFLPPIAIIWKGFLGFFELHQTVWAAAGRSVIVALLSTGLSLGAGFSLALASGKNTSYGIIALLPLGISSLILGLGVFILVGGILSPTDLAIPVTILVNALLSLPLIYHLLAIETRSIQTNYGSMADSLGLTGWNRLRFLFLPRLARPLGFGAGLAAAMSAGDLGVIALFSDGRFATLPLIIQQLMGSYRVSQAMAASLLLIMVSFGLFILFDTWGKRYVTP